MQKFRAQKFSFSPMAFTGLALLTLCGTAQADLKVVQTTSIDNPQLKAYEETMTPEQKAAMAKSGNPLFQSGPRQTTVYVHGAQTRTDIGFISYLVNGATHQTTVINRQTHTYTTQVYRSPSSAGLGTVTAKNTGQTKVIAGHLAQRYLTTATLASQPGTLIQGDIWAAPDIPQPPLMSNGSGPLAVLQNQFRKIKGYPLKLSLAVTGSPMGSTTFQTNVISVSKAALPASIFAVPAGYTKSAAEARG